MFAQSPGLLGFETNTGEPASTQVNRKPNDAPEAITTSGLAPSGACRVRLCCMAASARPKASAHDQANRRTPFTRIIRRVNAPESIFSMYKEVTSVESSHRDFQEAP